VPNHPLCSCCPFHVQNEFVFSKFNFCWSWQILQGLEGPTGITIIVRFEYSDIQLLTYFCRIRLQFIVKETTKKGAQVVTHEYFVTELCVLIHFLEEFVISRIVEPVSCRSGEGFKSETGVDNVTSQREYRSKPHVCIFSNSRFFIHLRGC
jgi:hypothetical protein